MTHIMVNRINFYKASDSLYRLIHSPKHPERVSQRIHLSSVIRCKYKITPTSYFSTSSIILSRIGFILMILLQFWSPQHFSQSIHPQKNHFRVSLSAYISRQTARFLNSVGYCCEIHRPLHLEKLCSNKPKP